MPRKRELKHVSRLEIELCGTFWDIFFLMNTDMPKDGDGDPVEGACYFDSQEIYINNKLHKHRKALALTHELLHVVFEPQHQRSEEKLIRAIEQGVYEIINNYPDEYKNH